MWRKATSSIYNEVNLSSIMYNIVWGWEATVICFPCQAVGSFSKGLYRPWCWPLHYMNHLLMLLRQSIQQNNVVHSTKNCRLFKIIQHNKTCSKGYHHPMKHTYFLWLLTSRNTLLTSEETGVFNILWSIWWGYPPTQNSDGLLSGIYKENNDP